MKFNFMLNRRVVEHYEMPLGYVWVETACPGFPYWIGLAPRVLKKLKEHIERNA